MFWPIPGPLPSASDLIMPSAAEFAEAVVDVYQLSPIMTDITVLPSR